MDLEALTVRISESERRHHETAIILENLKVTIDTKVSNKQFYWTMGVLFMLLMSTLSYIIYKMDAQSISQSITQSDVSYLKGKLTPYDVQFKN